MRVEEERRLWYVAMTRAKRYLTITTTENDQQKKHPSSFIDEIPVDNITNTSLSTNIEDIILINTAPLSPINWSDATNAELSKRAKNYILSVSALNAWIKSPRDFLEKYLIRKPSSKALPMSFGTAVHA